MFTTSRLAATLAATALTLLTATSARADIVTNDLDASVDSTLESMLLHVTPGTPATTKLSIVIEGHAAGDHPGCNIDGAPHYLKLSPVLSTPGVATVTLSGGGVFDACTDTVTATVTPVAVGQTTVTFGYQADTAGDPHLRFSTAEAAFKVTVDPGSDTSSTGTGCAKPAAPAWASALLKGNGLRPKAPANRGYISSVARHMGKGATFDGWVKSSRAGYSKAVWVYLQGLGVALPKGPAQVARPGWTCVALPSS
jgi:hypothetical protein